MPRAYRWSSYRAHADGAADALVGEHAIYRALGRGGEARRKAYRALFRGALDGEFVAALRAATHGGWALGDAGFARQIAGAVGRRAAKLAAGRPSNPRAVASSPGSTTSRARLWPQAAYFFSRSTTKVSLPLTRQLTIRFWSFTSQSTFLT